MKFTLVSLFALVAMVMANPLPGSGLVVRQEQEQNANELDEGSQEPQVNPEDIADAVPVEEAAMSDGGGEVTAYNAAGPGAAA
ncbi:hypothetical protein L249_0086 [Ophiocordyceps polyrhachis-furcata BCC 54312]|uniref:Secreted protein n=1 Tax=Ophiocordyceps polyrhachis-furcata BCC 54312 TaxID=1330021 RepID=A0A367LCC7_9HYPO|nr:hypothetical protein L249_0086 [Ophiocordyceps polyrhachis-furcata BCC 54312]